jgi:hypothetical protein
MGPRTGLDDVERSKILLFPELEPRPLGRPGRSQSLYQLRDVVVTVNLITQGRCFL